MIPFIDLYSQRTELNLRLMTVSKSIRSREVYLGSEVFELETALCRYTGAKHCISVANGTDAIQIALMALGISPGDEVITPAFAYIATAEATALLGAKPIYVDVDRDTFNLDTKVS